MSHPHGEPQSDAEGTSVDTGASEITAPPVHPMELVVQSLLESPLELLTLNLNSLYESQTILSSILKHIEQKLDCAITDLDLAKRRKDGVEEAAGSINDGNTELSLDEYAERVERLSVSMGRITRKLDEVEKRVARISRRMGCQN